MLVCVRIQCCHSSPSLCHAVSKSDELQVLHALPAFLCRRVLNFGFERCKESTSSEWMDQWGSLLGRCGWAEICQMHKRTNAQMQKCNKMRNANCQMRIDVCAKWTRAKFLTWLLRTNTRKETNDQPLWFCFFGWKSWCRWLDDGLKWYFNISLQGKGIFIYYYCNSI